MDKKIKMLEELKERILKMKEDRMREMQENPEKFKPQNPYELFGVECGDGWKHLYQPITDYINEYNKDKEGDDVIVIEQIKEKFGGLRYYASHYTDKLREIIRKAEEESYHTCETCGKHIDKPITENHWIYAECKECHDKWNKERLNNKFNEGSKGKSQEGGKAED